MTTYTVQISEEVYQRLQEEAARLHLTPDQVIERLVVSDLPSLLMDVDEVDIPIPRPGSPEARAAFQRLTTLFADLSMPDVDELITDPLLDWENVDLIDPDFTDVER